MSEKYNSRKGHFSFIANVMLAESRLAPMPNENIWFLIGMFSAK